MMQITKKYIASVDQQEALRYLGHRGSSIDDQVAQQLQRAAEQIEAVAEPAYTYRILSLEHRSETSVALTGTSLILTGHDISRLLRDSQRCIILAATIGRGFDALLQREQIRDMAGAVILNSCGSSAVESIVSQLNNDLESAFEEQGLYLTDRFSPGYGDLPLTLQPDICRILSTEKNIGVAPTSGLLLMPVKSVTAIIGIADHPQPKQISGCASCRMRSKCHFRKAGVTCAK